MNGFLASVAADLWARYGERLSALTMVFPSRRARLFFCDALAGIVDRPLWQPTDIQIDTIAEELSGLQNGERLRLVAELWKVYAEFHPTETFDDFYFWGELLIGDFDAVDKYLIDADVLFSNLVDLHALDARFDYLSAEQRAMIERFWGTFGTRKTPSPEQADFLRVWRTLAPIYHRFRARLHELGIGYQGMVYRKAAERIKSQTAPQLPERQYVIVGFNALSKSEQAIFEHLKKTSGAEFFWDWDEYFLKDPAQESAMFMRGNLRQFPPKNASAQSHDNFARPKRIRSVSTASDVLGCKWTGERLRELVATKVLDKKTAIVLCDETLLEPLLWSLPAEVEQVNVTMGYPLRLHPAYTFVERLVELQARRKKNAFYHSDVDGLLGHPYLTEGGARKAHKRIYVSAEKLRTNPLSETIFRAPDGWRAVSDYLTEAIAAVVERRPETEDVFALIADHIAALKEALERCAIDLSQKTYTTLLRRSLQSATLPFEGEPLAGVQVMGILETRALDFENIVFLSAGDATMPGSLTGAPSFIPYNLKMAYGLPTPEHHEGVWAYHFFRLLQRATNVDLVWSRTTDDRGVGEPSRYILQLDYESPHKVEYRQVGVDVALSPPAAIEVEKNPERIPRRMSPSLLGSWRECRLRFYFRAVARLRVDEEVSEEVDGALFGNILHGAMHRLYAPLVGRPGVRARIGALIGSPEVGRAVREASDELSPLDEGGAIRLAASSVERYIDERILPFDAAQTDDFTIEHLEHEAERELDGVAIFGRVDRIDRLSDGRRRVVDYKTGSSAGEARQAAVFQVGIYAWMLGGSTMASLYYVRELPAVIDLPDIDVAEVLGETLEEIFDPAQPFVQTDDTTRCQYCDYRAICGR